MSSLLPVSSSSGLNRSNVISPAFVHRCVISNRFHAKAQASVRIIFLDAQSNELEFDFLIRCVSGTVQPILVQWAERMGVDMRHIVCIDNRGLSRFIDQNSRIGIFAAHQEIVFGRCRGHWTLLHAVRNRFVDGLLFDVTFRRFIEILQSLTKILEARQMAIAQASTTFRYLWGGLNECGLREWGVDRFWILFGRRLLSGHRIRCTLAAIWIDFREEFLRTRWHAFDFLRNVRHIQIFACLLWARCERIQFLFENIFHRFGVARGESVRFVEFLSIADSSADRGRCHLPVVVVVAVSVVVTLELSATQQITRRLIFLLLRQCAVLLIVRKMIVCIYVGCVMAIITRRAFTVRRRIRCNLVRGVAAQK